MSELTPCNYCSLKEIEHHYGKVNVSRGRDPEMPGYVAIFVKKDGREEVVAWMQEITDHCFC